MERHQSGKLPIFINTLTSVGSAIYILVFLVLGFIRIQYPFELEWIEGAFLDQVRWIAAGNFPYRAPSLEFIPTSKTPLYFYLAAGFYRIFPSGFFGPRLLSYLSTLGIYFFLFKVVHEETGSRTAGILSAGIYAASFRFTGAWMDLAKTDSLALFLLIGAYWLGKRGEKSIWPQVVSGILFALAYFTKQIALPVILGVALASLIGSWGRSWPQWLAAALAGALVFLGLELFSEGWFSFYTISTSIRHERSLNFNNFWERFAPVMWPA